MRNFHKAEEYTDTVMLTVSLPTHKMSEKEAKEYLYDLRTMKSILPNRKSKIYLNKGIFKDTITIVLTNTTLKIYINSTDFETPNDILVNYIVSYRDKVDEFSNTLDSFAKNYRDFARKFIDEMTPEVLSAYNTMKKYVRIDIEGTKILYFRDILSKGIKIYYGNKTYFIGIKDDKIFEMKLDGYPFYDSILTPHNINDIYTVFKIVEKINSYTPKTNTEKFLYMIRNNPDITEIKTENGLTLEVKKNDESCTIVNDEFYELLRLIK